MENASITLYIEYDVEPEYEKIRFNFEDLVLDKSPIRLTFSVHRKLKFSIYFMRDFSFEEFNSWKKKRMTGMLVTWKYNQNFKNKAYFQKSNKDFIKIANMLVEVGSERTMWNNIKDAKVDWFVEKEYSYSWSSRTKRPEICKIKIHSSVLTQYQ